MNRIVLWCLSTLSVLVLLFSYHTSTTSTLAAGTPPSAVSGSTPGGTSSSGSSKSSTVTGSVASTQWGPVQVQLTLTGGRITNVTMLQYPNGNSTDSVINSRALPTLKRETIDKQSANIDMVSGATVTSTGYEQSLQSALDQAGL
jgi:uncharacterized protein with FMN-binding domain